MVTGTLPFLRQLTLGTPCFLPGDKQCGIGAKTTFMNILMKKSSSLKHKHGMNKIKQVSKAQVLEHKVLLIVLPLHMIYVHV